MNILTIRQLQYITALADVQSFSKAAEQCNVTQSTLSAGIKEAETLLGRAIVDRSKRKPSLTAFGSDILDHARTILEKSEQISLLAKQYDKPMSAPIRLGIIPTIAPYLLPRLLPLMQARYPDLHLQIFEDLSDRLHTDLVRGHLDLLIMAFPYHTEGAHQHILFDEDFYLASPSSAPNAPHDHDVICSTELDPNTLLLLSDGHCLSDHALQACDLQRPSKRKSYSASSLTTLIQMVGHGMGETLLPAMVIESGQLPASIQTRPFKRPAPKRTIGMAWRDTSQRSADYMEIAALICDNLAPATIS